MFHGVGNVHHGAVGALLQHIGRTVAAIGSRVAQFGATIADGVGSAFASLGRTVGHAQDHARQSGASERLVLENDFSSSGEEAVVSECPSIVPRVMPLSFEEDSSSSDEEIFDLRPVSRGMVRSAISLNTLDRIGSALKKNPYALAAMEIFHITEAEGVAISLLIANGDELNEELSQEDPDPMFLALVSLISSGLAKLPPYANQELRRVGHKLCYRVPCPVFKSRKEAGHFRRGEIVACPGFMSNIQSRATGVFVTLFAKPNSKARYVGDFTPGGPGPAIVFPAYFT